MVMPLPLALTDSIHLNTQRRHENESQQEHDDNPLYDSDDTSSSQSQRSTRRVYFDPRVTITEYNDKVPREWYTDSELDKFKFDTILLAQRFLRSRPELAVDYCTGLVDPTTGVVRKKALYSLPILNDVTVNGESKTETSAGSPLLFALLETSLSPFILTRNT